MTEFEAAQEELDRIVGDAIRLFESSARHVGRQYGAAALRRACDLLNSMRACLDREATAAIGPTCRTLFETWVCGLYLMLKGFPALLSFENEHTRIEGLMVATGAPDASTLISERREALDTAAVRAGFDTRTDGKVIYPSIGVKTMLDELGPLMRKRYGGDQSPIAGLLYDLVYRPLSTYEAHGFGR